MTENLNTKIPVWYWIAAVLALIWNGLGIMNYIGRAYITDEMIAALPVEQQAEFLVEHPTWYTAAFAIAVFAGFLGAISLLIKKKWAYMLFFVSAIAAIAQHIYIFMNVEALSYIMPIMVIVVCIALIYLAKHAIKKSWIS